MLKKKSIMTILIASMILFVGCSNKDEYTSEIKRLNSELNLKNASIESIKEENRILEIKLENINKQLGDIEDDFELYKNEVEIDNAGLSRYVSDLYKNYCGVILYKLDEKYTILERLNIEYTMDNISVYNTETNEVKELDSLPYGVSYVSYDSGVVKCYYDGTWFAGDYISAPAYIYYDIENGTSKFENVFFELEKKLTVGANSCKCKIVDVNVVEKSIEFTYIGLVEASYAGGSFAPTINLGKEVDGKFVIEVVDTIIKEDAIKQFIERLSNQEFINNVEIELEEKEDKEVNTVIYLELNNIKNYNCDYGNGDFVVNFTE